MLCLHSAIIRKLAEALLLPPASAPARTPAPALGKLSYPSGVCWGAQPPATPCKSEHNILLQLVVLRWMDRNSDPEYYSLGAIHFKGRNWRTFLKITLIMEESLFSSYCIIKCTCWGFIFQRRILVSLDGLTEILGRFSVVLMSLRLERKNLWI